MNTTVIATAILLAALTASRPTHAGTQVWDASAVECVLDPASRTPGHYTKVYSVGNNGAGTTTLYCGVSSTSGLFPSALRLIYSDDTASSSFQIKATYYRMLVNGASAGSPVEQIATINTSMPGCGATTSGLKACSVSFSEPFNMGAYYYFVRIDIIGGAATNEQFYSVGLF